MFTFIFLVTFRTCHSLCVLVVALCYFWVTWIVLYVSLSFLKSQWRYVSGVNGEAGAPGGACAPGTTGVDPISSINVGVVYTRWGKRECGDHSELIYRGM